MADEDELKALSDELESIKETSLINTIQLRQMVEELRGLLPLMDNPRNLGEKIEEIRNRLAEPQGVRENATDTNFQGLLPNTLKEPKERDPAEKFDRQQEMMDLASDEIHDNKPTESVKACCEAKNLVLGSVKSTTPEDEDVVELDNNSDNLVSSEKDSGKDRAVTSVQRLQEHNDVEKKPFSRKPINQFIPWISAQQGNFCSSQPSMYRNQFLKVWEQLLTLENIGERIVLLAQNRVWNGLLNLKLERRLSEKEMILPDVMDFLGELMKNQFGSLFVHKLFMVCNEDQVLIKVAVATPNPIHFKRSLGIHKATDFPLLTGPDYDIIRVVVKVGSKLKDLKERDEVNGNLSEKALDRLKSFGSLVEYTTVEKKLLAPKSMSLDFLQAVVFSLAIETAYQVLGRVGFFQGKSILVLGEISGVEYLTIQLVKQNFGASKLTATASTGKLEFLESLGADPALGHTTESFEDLEGKYEDDKATSKYTRIKETTREIYECNLIIGMNYCFRVKKWPDEPLPPPEPPPPPWVGLYLRLQSSQALSNTDDLVKILLSMSMTRKLLARQIAEAPGKRLWVTCKTNVQFLHAFPKTCDEDAKILISKLQKSVLEELKTHNMPGQMCIPQATTIKCINFLLTTVLKNVEEMEDLIVLTLLILEDKDYQKGRVL